MKFNLSVYFQILAAPVTFTVPLKDTSVTDGESVTLECETSKPGQKVKWLKDGKEIKSDKTRKITSDQTKHKLTLPKSTSKDAAEYTVQIGDVKTTATLEVVGKCFIPFSSI